MPTEAQLQANRENAKKSCGPETDDGKARVRLNALKHGLRAKTVNPVLPQEDPAELEAKIQEWLDDHQPTNAVERDLVTRAARLSWTLDRAERYETALLSEAGPKGHAPLQRQADGKGLRAGPKAVLHGGKAAAPGLRPGLGRQPVGLRRAAGRVARRSAVAPRSVGGNALPARSPTKTGRSSTSSNSSGSWESSLFMRSTTPS